MTVNFNPSDHLMKLQGKDYLEVKWRLVWFRDKFPNGSIETELLTLDLDRETEEEVMVWNDEKKRKEKAIRRANGFAVFKAIVKDGQGGVGTGTKSEKAASFPDYIEKAESGSIGRALAALGFGTQFTGDELAEHHRIVDSPVDRSPDAANGNGHKNASSNGKAPSAQAEAQSTALLDMIARAKKRAQTLGIAHDKVEWETFLQGLFNNPDFTDKDITLISIPKINGELTKREQPVAAAQ